MFVRAMQAHLLVFVLMGGFLAAADLCAQAGVWRKAPDIPFSGRQGVTVTTYNNQLWAIGGFDYGYNDDVWSSPDGASWTLQAVGAPFKPRTGHSAVAFNGRLWVIAGNATTGGSPPTALKNDLWSTLDGFNWTLEQPAAPWPPRQYHATLVFNNRLWVMGGLDNSGVYSLNDVWSSSDGINWTQEIANAPWTTRWAFGAATFNNRMWISSGVGAPGGVDVWSSSDGVNWILETTNPGWTGRYAFTLTSYKGRLWAAGGESWQYLNDVWSTTDGINWNQETGAAPWPARGWHAAAVLNDQLWIVSGIDGNFYRRDVWSFGFPGRITSAPPTTAVAGAPYSYSVAADGDPAPVIGASGLPGWLLITGNVISGTPTAADIGATAPITVTATNNVGTDTQVFQITVSGVPPQIVSSPISIVSVGTSYSYTVVAAGTPPPTLSTGALPPWLAFSSATGELGGTPSASDVGLTQPITITAANISGSASQIFQISVVGAPPQITSTPVTTIQANAPYSYAVQAAGTPAPMLSTPSLPSWLTFNTATGVLSGTPTMNELGLTGVVTIVASNGTLPDAVQSFQLFVVEPPMITTIEKVTSKDDSGCAVPGGVQPPFAAGALVLCAGWVLLRSRRRKSETGRART